MNVSFLARQTRKHISEAEITRVDCTAPDIGTVRSVCMECKAVYRVRVYDAAVTVARPGDTADSHGYCPTCEETALEAAEAHEPLTGGI